MRQVRGEELQQGNVVLGAVGVVVQVPDHVLHLGERGEMEYLRKIEESYVKI